MEVRAGSGRELRTTGLVGKLGGKKDSDGGVNPAAACARSPGFEAASLGLNCSLILSRRPLDFAEGSPFSVAPSGTSPAHLLL